MSVIKKIYLDITERTPLGYVYAKQGDINSRTLEIQLLNSGVVYEIPENTTAKFRLRKPDKTQVMNDAEINENVITAELTEQCLAVEGVALAEIGLYGADGSLLTSETFMIKIVSTTVNDEEIKSSDEFGTLTEALVKVESAVELAEMARDAADEALEEINQTKTEETARAKAEAARVEAETARATAETARNAAETKRAESENARDTAEKNRVNAETARAKAEKDRADAEAARVEAETARASAFEGLKERTVKRYGARRVIGASSPTLERIWDAVGLTANVGVDATTVVNDFDNIYPWSHVRTCNIEVVDGEIRVKAYEGEPTFARDGSNGNVAVEFPEFYSCPPYLNDDGYEYFGVSEYPIGGWIKHEKAYYAAYNAGMYGDKLMSVSGVFPRVSTSRTAFRTLAKESDALCGLIDLKYHDTFSTLFTVEFATINSQSKMQGATALSSTIGSTVIAETGVNRVILSNASAQNAVIGQTITIGTVENRRIISIEDYDTNNKAIYFDGETADITAGTSVSSRGWITGATDNVAASSGSIVSNTSGKYPCKYRGIENPWGNVWQWVDGVNINNRQAYICLNREEYTDNKYDGNYISLNYINATTNGYVKERGYDERYPFARFPTTVGGDSVTYYSDNYYQSSGERALCFGGSCADGAAAGLWYFYANTAASHTGVYIGARLSWKTV